MPATLHGGGAIETFYPMEARGSLPAHMLGTGSALRELFGILQLLKSFVSVLAGKAVKLRTDSLAAERIQFAGSHMNQLYNNILTEIFEFCILHSIRLELWWVPRAKNTWADSLSKLRDNDDWKLRPEIFARISQWWGPFTIDRFASELNKQLPRFNSRWWCPGTEAVDAFTQHWGADFNWLNPPFSLIPRVLLHMRFCKAKGVLIVPKWESRPWWHLLFPAPGRPAHFVKKSHYFPKKTNLFCASFAGSVETRLPPKFVCIALLIDFSEK
jgi:hypothetical protein